MDADELIRENARLQWDSDEIEILLAALDAAIEAQAVANARLIAMVSAVRYRLTMAKERVEAS